LSPHEIRLRRRHCRTPIWLLAACDRPQHFINGRTRTATGSRASCFQSDRPPADDDTDLTIINPFDCFVEPYAETFRSPIRRS
jgi:hypothetical protein